MGAAAEGQWRGADHSQASDSQGKEVLPGVDVELSWVLAMEKVDGNVDGIVEKTLVAAFAILIISTPLAFAYRLYADWTKPPPITKGVVVDKCYEPPITRTNMSPMVTPSFDGTSTTITWNLDEEYDDEDYYVTIRGKDASGEEVDREIEVTKEAFDKVKIGLEYEFDK